jgi:hypothetical protein
MVAKSSSMALPSMFILGSPSVFFGFSGVSCFSALWKKGQQEEKLFRLAQTTMVRGALWGIHLVRATRATKNIIAGGSALVGLATECHCEGSCDGMVSLESF